MRGGVGVDDAAEGGKVNRAPKAHGRRSKGSDGSGRGGYSAARLGCGSLEVKGLPPLGVRAQGSLPIKAGGPRSVDAHRISGRAAALVGVAGQYRWAWFVFFLVVFCLFLFFFFRLFSFLS